MKTTAALWLLFAWPILVTATDAPFKCVLSADKTTLIQGQNLSVQVLIKNGSDKDIRLPGCLDGSESKVRFPLCYITLTDGAGKPVPRKLPLVGCGTMNPLLSTDFVKVKSGSTFDPFGEGFFGSEEMERIKELRPGTYILRFYYQTSTRGVQDYFGDERNSTKPVVSPEIQKLFESVPAVDIQSNDLKITVLP